MKLNSEQLRALLTALPRTREVEINCNEFLHHAGYLADLHLTDADIPSALRAVQNHLEICEECREEYEALYQALKELDHTTD